LGAGLGWLLGRKALRPYNDERVHLGYGLAGWTLDGCGVSLGFRGSSYVGLMLVVLWDEMVLDWLRADLPAVNDVLTHYRFIGVLRRDNTVYYLLFLSEHVE